MNPDSRERTPEKKVPEAHMELIRTPQSWKKEDLYERLIRASPPRVLFSYANDDSDPSGEAQNSSSNSDSSALLPGIKGEQIDAEKQDKDGQEKNRVIQYQVTPQKPAKVSKGCHCEKSHCLKKYCDCYKLGQVCSEDCACIGCENQHVTVTHKKLQKMAELTRSGKGGKGPSCNCQKSHCLKNYCQCHSAGRMCSQSCNCIQCDNKINSDKGYSGHKRRHPNPIAEWDGDSSGRKNILFNNQ